MCAPSSRHARKVFRAGPYASSIYLAWRSEQRGRFARPVFEREGGNSYMEFCYVDLVAREIPSTPLQLVAIIRRSNAASLGSSNTLLASYFVAS